MPEPLPPALERVLREQQISETAPGSILRDFATFLDFLASRQVITTGKHHLLPGDSLAELNARMTQPVEIRLKRPMQKSYPNLQGLYLLARATGLMRVQKVKAGALLALDGPAMDSWGGLNPTERYFALLEAWWLRASSEMVGERGRGWMRGMQSECLMIWQRITERGLKIDQRLAASLPFWGMHHLALMEMFGLLRITRGKPQRDKGWIIAGLKRTEFGTALVRLIAQEFTPERLLAEMLAEDEEGEAEEGGEEVFDGYRELALPYFPEWRQSLRLPPAEEYRDGVYTFKVALGPVWRRIAIPAKSMLADLSGAIQGAFDFDDDHLHCFIYKDRFGLSLRINHFYMDEPPHSDEVRVGEVPLRPGEAMEYVFDFGDNWQFDVLLETIDPPKPKMKRPAIIASHGKAPPQYRDWDEEEADEAD